MDMKPLSAFVLAAGIALAGAGIAGAHTASHGPLQVIHPWIDPASRGGDTNVHPTIANNGGAPVRIVGVEVPVAGTVEMRLNDEPVDMVTIDAGETLAPDTFRIRLENVAHDLPAGKAIAMTFRFEDMQPLRIKAAIGETTMDPRELVGPDA